MIATMSRWVDRRGKVVTFGNVVGGHVGSTYTYKFPTTAKAKEFQAVAKEGTDTMPSAIDPDVWGKFRVKDQ